MAEDFIITDEPTPGLRRLAARFRGHAYDPHRHETYAIGRTLAGAQAFRYRGEDRVSHTGECMVIHPDETHDGHAGAPEGFTYQMIYVEPWLLQGALVNKSALPFVADVVARDAALSALLAETFADFPAAFEPLELDAFLVRLADLLTVRGDARATSARAFDMADKVATARAFLLEEYGNPIDSADLERVTGLDRFELARAFRRFAGTSPHRYLVGRRLAAAHSHIARGDSLADAAAAAGFADQSHMTRHFKARYGMTPGRFANLASDRAA